MTRYRKSDIDQHGDWQSDRRPAVNVKHYPDVTDDVIRKVCDDEGYDAELMLEWLHYLDIGDPRACTAHGETWIVSYSAVSR